MRNKIEDRWNEMHGEVYHVQITNVYPWNSNSIKVSGKILETDDCFDFEVITEEE